MSRRVVCECGLGVMGESWGATGSDWRVTGLGEGDEVDSVVVLVGSWNRLMYTYICLPLASARPACLMGQRHCRELSIPLLAREMHRGKDRYHYLEMFILPF